MQLLQRLAGHDSELLVEKPVRQAVRGQRFALTAGAIPRKHELPPGVLAQRLGLYEPGQLGGRLLVPAGSQRGGGPPFEHEQPALFQANGLGAQRRGEVEARQRFAAPQVQRLRSSAWRNRRSAVCGSARRMACSAASARPSKRIRSSSVRSMVSR